MIVVRQTTREEWNKAIAEFPESNMLQSWQWGELQERLGHKPVRYLITRDSAVVGLVAGFIRDARRGRYLEIPGGPLIDWSDKDLAVEILAELSQIGREHNCVFIRLRPQCADDPELRALLAKHGAKLSPMHVTADHTVLVDLAPDTETLLTSMRQQTRYEVKRAPKREVVVSSTRDMASIDTFYELQADTAMRQGFIPPSKKYLTGLLEIFGDGVTIYQATKHDQLLNLAIVINYGREAAYLEAASTLEARREPGAYAIIWQAMQDAKSRGIERFNLWGIAPPDSPGHRYAGVTTFKQGFGGEDFTYLAPHDIVLNPVKYQLTKLIEMARKKRRHL